jgi:NRPS condensation-like uncharacterized protein
MEKLKILTERPFLRSPGLHVCVKGEIKGAFSDNEFLYALEMLCKRHPLLLSTISLENDGDAYYLFNNSKKIEVEFDRYIDEDQWQIWYEKTDNQHFDFETGPLMKICVIRNQDNTIIVIIGHHILGDGLAYMNLFRDLMKALNGELDSAELTPPIVKVLSKLPSKAKFGLVPRIFVHDLNNSWKRTGKKFTNEEFYKFFYDYRSRNKPGLYINSIEKESTEKLISKCHEKRVTINEALLTAFLYSIQKADEKHIGKTDEVGVAINIRNELTPLPGECMGNFVSGILTRIKYDYEKEFWENAGMISTELRKKVKNQISRFIALNLVAKLNPDLLDSISFAEYGGYNNKVSKKLAGILGERNVDKGIGISNLGKFEINLNRPGFEINNVIFIQPAYPADDICIGVVTINSRMNFCLRYIKSVKSFKLIDEIFHEAINSLTNSSYM